MCSHAVGPDLGLPSSVMPCFVVCFSHAHSQAGKVSIATDSKVYPDLVCCSFAQTFLASTVLLMTLLLRLLPASVPTYVILHMNLVLQLLSWKAYSAAKRAGTVVSLLESMRPPEAEQAGRSKRKKRSTATAGVDAPPSDDDNTAKTGPVKRLKTTVSNCRMM